MTDFVVFASLGDTIANQVIILLAQSEITPPGFTEAGNFSVEEGEPTSVNGDHIYVVKARQVLEDAEIPYNARTEFHDRASNAAEPLIDQGIGVVHDDDSMKGSQIDAAEPADGGLTSSQHPANQIDESGNVQTGEPIGAGSETSTGVAEEQQAAGAAADTSLTDEHPAKPQPAPVDPYEEHEDHVDGDEPATTSEAEEEQKNA